MNADGKLNDTNVHGIFSTKARIMPKIVLIFEMLTGLMMHLSAMKVNIRLKGDKTMTELEKMKGYHAMQTIKEMPEWSQKMALVILCKADKSGRAERIARILADYGMDVKKIVPCIMDIMQDLLVDIDCDGKPLLGGEVE